MDRLDLDLRSRVALGPVLAEIQRGMEHLPDVSPLKVRMGDVPGLYRLHGDELTLSAGFEGPDVVHPAEPESPLPPLDRWRRAAATVLEATALRGLSQLVQQPPGTDWRWIGAAVYAADQVAPELGIAANDLAQAVETGDPGRFPRAGVAVGKAWAAQGHDPISRSRDLLDDGVLSATEWLGIGRWILEKAPATLPVPLRRVPAVDIPVVLAPWRWVPLDIPAHSRGGQVGVTGDGEVAERYAVAGKVHRTLAASAAGGCTLTAEPGGPVGDWSVASAEGFGQVMGARGVDFRFQASGRLEVILADAFVGPLAAVGVAGQVGTSGVADGRWSVAGPQQLRFEGIVPQGLTMHGRTRDRFMVPANGFGMGEWLQAMCDEPWGWGVQGDRLILRGRIGGAGVEVRLRKEG